MMGMKGREWGGGNEGTGIGRWGIGNRGSQCTYRIIFSSAQSTQTPLIFFAAIFNLSSCIGLDRCGAGWKGAKDHELKGATANREGKSSIS